MNEVKYTRGPWAVNEDGFKVESAEEHGWVNDGWVICVTEGPDKEANARLIAAAPTMLEFVAAKASAGDIEAIAILEAINGNA